MLAGWKVKLVEMAVKHQNNSWLYYEIWARLCTQTRYTMVSICLLPTLAFSPPQNVCSLAEEGKLMVALAKELFLCLNSHLVSHNTASATGPVAKGWAKRPKQDTALQPRSPQVKGNSHSLQPADYSFARTPPLRLQSTLSQDKEASAEKAVGARWDCWLAG